MRCKPLNFRRRNNYALPASILVGILSGLLWANSVFAQTEAAHNPADSRPTRTFYLNSGTSVNESNEVLTGLRLMLESNVRLYLMPAENAIVVRGTPAQIELAGKLVAELNRPRKNYQLIYTLSEVDGGKRIGVQHYTLQIFPGASMTLKQGSKVPVATGSLSSTDAGSSTTQFTYLDVGINLEATLDESADGARLRCKIEQSGVVEDRTLAGVAEPVIRQTVLEGTSLLQPAKPVTLGSLDVPGSTRHIDVEVVLEPSR